MLAVKAKVLLRLSLCLRVMFKKLFTLSCIIGFQCSAQSQLDLPEFCNGYNNVVPITTLLTECTKTPLRKSLTWVVNEQERKVVITSTLEVDELLIALFNKATLQDLHEEYPGMLLEIHAPYLCKPLFLTASDPVSVINPNTVANCGRLRALAFNQITADALFTSNDGLDVSAMIKSLSFIKEYDLSVSKVSPNSNVFRIHTLRPKKNIVFTEGNKWEYLQIFLVVNTAYNTIDLIVDSRFASGFKPPELSRFTVTETKYYFELSSFISKIQSELETSLP